jgi:WD40 repeat protein
VGGYVFVSYAREDEAYVTTLAGHLGKQGVEVWTDAAIYFGDRYRKVIEERIDACAAFVVVMSPAARGSEWVDREIQHARSQDKQVFPLLLSGKVFFTINDLHYEDVTDGRQPPPDWVDHLRAVAGRADVLPPQLPPQPVSWRERATLDGHSGAVLSVAFAPDGRALATGSDDRTVRLWEPATGRQTATLKLEGFLNVVSSVAFAPDGRTLATGSAYPTARLWEPATGRQTATLDGHTSAVLSVAFAPDGRTLATGSDDKTVRLWEVATGRQIEILTGHTSGVNSVAFAPDGRTLASGSGDKTVRLWEPG